MKKFLLSISFISVFCFSQSQVITGSEAWSKVEGSSILRWNEQYQIPDFVKFYTENRPQQEAISLWAKNHLNLKEADGLRFLNTTPDELGMVHYRYLQTYHGIPVEGSMLITHTLNGMVESYNGEVYPGLNVNLSANLTEDQALSIALDKVKASLYKWQILTDEAILKTLENNPQATYYPKAEMVIVSKDNSRKIEDYRYAFKFNVYAEEPLSRELIYVDAITGEILFAHDQIHTGNSPGTAHTKYSGIRTIITDSVSPTLYRLKETSRGNGVETYNLNNSQTVPTNSANWINFTDSDNVWNNVNAKKDEVATDAHWGAEMVYDYFKNIHNRNSLNNNGFKLISFVHYGTNYNNAFWNGQYMHYGDGNGTTFTPLTALDVCGHEVAHGLTSNTSNLVYSYESGALNESFSDIFGTAVEFYGRNNLGNWIIGEDMTPGGNGIRNMVNPKLFQDPACYNGQYWFTGAGDNGGVHTNSGVQNFWFYLLTMGGNGTNDLGKAYNVSGIGILNAGKIAFRNNTVYLTPNSKYADARFFAIQSASDLFGSCSNEVKQTTNAWYACGVGNQFDTIVKANFYALDSINCASPATVKFYNLSQSSTSYKWIFHDGTTSTLQNPTKVYGATGNYTVKLVVDGCSPGTKDSITKTNYIVVDPAATFCQIQKMPTGTTTGATLTQCNGRLTDDGGNGTYSNNVNSTRSIAPTGAAAIRLKFNSFNMEANFDYLFIYDGPNINSKLIGRYTGTTLPNGGEIVTSGGIVTFRQVTDGATTANGFEVDWKCIPRIPNDLGVVSVIGMTSGRENTSLPIKSTQQVKVVVKNNGTIQQNNIPISYTVNNGVPVSETFITLLEPNELDTFSFSVPFSQSGYGTFLVNAFSSLPGDTNTFNDTASFAVKQLENKPYVLPFFEGFEKMAVQTNTSYSFGLDNAERFDYSNDDTLGLGRLRTAAGAGFYKSGSKAITLDRNNSNAGGQNTTNFLFLTLDLTNYNTKKVMLDFSYMQHGEESHANDRVWIRGNDQAAWIMVYDLYANRATTGTYKNIIGLAISDSLSAKAQNFGSSFQIRIGQQDNANAQNTTTNDGATFDDIKIYVDGTATDVELRAVVSPGSLSTPGNKPLTIRLRNVGIQSQTNIPVSFSLNGFNPINETVGATLNVGDTIDYTFNLPLNLVAAGSNTLKTWVGVANDANRNNDTLNKIIMVANSGLKAAVDNSINIYPNPANEKVEIESQSNMQRIKLMDLTGRAIYEFEKVGNKFIIYTDKLAIGSYYIVIETQSGTDTRKLQIIK